MRKNREAPMLGFLNRNMGKGFKIRDKRGLSTVETIIGTVGSFVFAIIILLLVVSILGDTSFFTAGSSEDNLVGNLSLNVVAGATEVAIKVPLAFQVGALVFIVSILAILFILARRNGLIGGGGQLG